ncbi:uroporphyrinogen-III synthase [Candidatus Acetothermia bacterium]|nr:uroporphyrinogen-III synthase [Candidatus Acetothermia bacterium]MBI3642484.1 uroporphyrinogen-III synthase [Candidatus Acetothermia bacterium]
MNRPLKISKPDSLTGLKILVTRPEGNTEALAESLRALGAEAIELPTIRFAPPESYALVDEALKRLSRHEYQWCIFTSVNGVQFLWSRLSGLKYTNAIWQDVNLAAIGPATAEAICSKGRDVHVVPEVFVAEEIAKGLGGVNGLRILLPRADIARKALPKILRESGAIVDEVAVYRTLPVQIEKDRLAQIRKMFEKNEIDVITFTSSSTVNSFIKLMTSAGLIKSQIQSAKMACIGPITEKTARELGLHVSIVAREHTIPGLIAKLIEELGSYE